MLHSCEGPSSVVDHSAPQSCLNGVKAAQGVVEGQGGYEAFLWEVAYVGHRPVMDSAAGNALNITAMLYACKVCDINFFSWTSDDCQLLHAT